jgi:hypothetical protein
MVRPTIPSFTRRLGLRVVALGLLSLLITAMAGPAIVAEERALACKLEAPSQGDDLSGLADDGALPLNLDPSTLPPVLREIAEHAHPEFGTDGSHDIPNAAKTHDAELDREAMQGMDRPSPRSGPSVSKTEAAASLDESLAAARAHPLPPRGTPLAEGLGPRRRHQ